MIEGIEPFYEQIAESIESQIPEAWTTACVNAIFYSQHTFYSGEYTTADSGVVKAFATSRDGRRAFEAIRELFVRAGKPLWCRSRFEYRSNGEFKMHWGYDDCDTNGFARFDEDTELQRMKDLGDRK